MRFLCITLILIFSQCLLAQNDNAIRAANKKIEIFIKNITSVNNIDIFLKMYKKELPQDVYNQLVKTARKTPGNSKFFHAKKISADSFALKLKNSKMAIFKINLNDGHLLIGKTSFKWNFKNSAQSNIDKISLIMKSEFATNNASTPQFLIPSAYADDDSTGNDTAASAVAAYLAEEVSVEVFIENMDHHCQGKYVLYGKALEDTLFVREKFLEARDNFEQKWKSFVSRGAYERFDRVQKCLNKRGIISKDQFYKDEYMDKLNTKDGVLQ